MNFPRENSPKGSRQIETQATGVACIVLAAGQGKRMRSELPKVIHPALGKPLVHWSLDALRNAGFSRAAVVVSPSQPAVHDSVAAYSKRHRGFGVHQALQHQALGTGDAARAGFEVLVETAPRGVEQTILIVTGDTPLLTPETLRDFVHFHKAGEYAASLIAFRNSNPYGYGRVLRDADDNFLAIREEKDCLPEEKTIDLCNSGIMCVEAKVFGELLALLEPNNAAGEYYLTDVPRHALGLDLRLHGTRGVGVFVHEDSTEFDGVNTQRQLAAVAEELQRRVIERWMDAGVVFEAPHLAYIEESVELSSGVVVEPFVCLRGEHHIGPGTRIRSGTGLSFGAER